VAAEVVEYKGVLSMNSHTLHQFIIYRLSKEFVRACLVPCCVAGEVVEYKGVLSINSHILHQFIIYRLSKEFVRACLVPCCVASQLRVEIAFFFLLWLQLKSIPLSPRPKSKTNNQATYGWVGLLPTGWISTGISAPQRLIKPKIEDQQKRVI
jgi:hypothetical protein